MKNLDAEMEKITGKKPTKAEKQRQEHQDLQRQQKAAAKREDGLASEMLAEIKLTNKRLFMALRVIVILWTLTIAGFLFYLYQYDFSGTTTNTAEATGFYALADSNGNMIAQDVTPEEWAAFTEWWVVNGESETSIYDNQIEGS